MTNGNVEETGEADPTATAIDLVDFPEQLRGQAVHAAIDTGIIEALGDGPETPEALAAKLGLDPAYTERLCRALAVYGVLAAEAELVQLTSVGERFLPGHPESVRDFVLFFYHPDRFAAVRHMPDIVRDGHETGYEREFGHGLFDHCERDPEFARYFSGFQNLGHTLGTLKETLEQLTAIDFGRLETLCDIGGGYGDVLCHLLDQYPELEGIVYDLPNVIEQTDRHWAPRLGVEDRCRYVAGDMFESVPTADAYFLQSILHDWSDDACRDILQRVREGADGDATLFIRERVLSPSNPEENAIDLDLWMLLETGGRERTRAEFEGLLHPTGWEIRRVVETDHHMSTLVCERR